MKFERGFTVLELLVTLLVLSVLVAIATSRFSGVTSPMKSKADVLSAQAITRETETRLITGIIPLTNGLVIGDDPQESFQYYGDSMFLNAQVENDNGAQKTFHVKLSNSTTDMWLIQVYYNDDTNSSNPLAERSINIIN